LLPAEARALDMGCAVGRSSFELARHCRSVIGIDYSHAFIEAARRLQRGEALPFRYVIEGDRWAEGTATAPGRIELPRVEFQQGDALALPEDLGDFDVVLMANLIDRLPDPRRLLENLPRLVRPGGQLIFVSPYTWTEEYTPRSAWLSGSAGESESSFEAIRQSLAPHFRLLNRKDLPFLIREHARKFQWSVAEAAVWQRLS
jgi:putative 4-mercaptohistidine N1-methyltranferase